MSGRHVGLNALLLSTAPNYRGAGVSGYCLNLVAALGELAVRGETACRFTAFVSEPELTVAGVETVRAGRPTANPLLRILWEQLALPRQLKGRDVEILHGLVNVLPLAGSVAGVVTVHDLSFLRLPKMFPLAKRRYLSTLCRASAHRAQRVIAVSRQTADDLIREFGVPASRIHVVHNGVHRRFSPGQPGQLRSFRRQRGLPERFFLYLGTLEPRKNLARLIQAFDQWQRQAGSDAEGMKLVLAGGRGWYYEEIFRQVRALNLEEDVLFPGYIPGDELPNWYRAATALVYPSLYEGFGLPVLEAMACGTPVICSTAPSLREVAGEYALYVSAEDTAELARALGRIAASSELRLQLVRGGLQQARRFSWHESARRTVEVYDGI